MTFLRTVLALTLLSGLMGNAFAQLPVFYDEEEKPLMETCNKQGGAWIRTPPAHCENKEFWAGKTKCDNMATKEHYWLWNGVTYKFECFTVNGGGTSPIFEGLKEKCLAAGNEWLEESYPHYCLTPELKKSRKDCFERSGKFFWDGLNNKFSCYVSSYDQKALEECKGKGGQYGRFGGSHIKYCRLPDEGVRKQKCLNDGGKWGPQGMAGVPGCVSNFSDGGKTCQRNEDCLSKKCLAEKGNEDHGVCAKDDQLFGCFSYFQKNEKGMRISLCVD